MIGELSGLISAAMWAGVSNAMRSLSNRMGATQVSGLRCSIGALSMLVLLTALGRTEGLFGLSWQSVAMLIVIGVLAQGMGDSLYVRSLKLLGAPRAIPITSSYPLLTMVVAILFLGERLTWIGIAGGVLALGGVYLVAFPRGRIKGSGRQLDADDRLGMLCALATACCWTSSTVLLKLVATGLDPLAVTFVRQGTGGIWNLAAQAISLRRPLTGLNRRSIIIVSFAGLGGALTSFTFVLCLQLAGAAKAAILSSTSPLFALPMSLVFLKEKINRQIVLGTLISVLGIGMVLSG